MSNDGGVDGGGADDIGNGSIPRKKKIIWEDEQVGLFLELLDIELAKMRYKQKLPKEIGRDRICKEFLENTGLSLHWDCFKSKYDILRNKWGSFKRLNNFTGVSVDHSTGVITMDAEWWDDREKEIKYAKDIKENGIPHMEHMRRIFGRQGNKPEAMYPTHAQGPKNADDTEGEPMDKSVPITQDNDADDSNLNPTNDVHLQSPNITPESPPLSLFGPSKRSSGKQFRVTPYASNRGKEILQSREKHIPRRKKAFETEISEHFKEMMELRRAQVEESKQRREKNEAPPYKEAYLVMQSIQSLAKWTDFWWACIKVLKEDPFAREMMVYNESDDDIIRFMEGYTGYDCAGNYIGDRLNKLESCKGYYPSGNLEQDMENTNVESHKEFNATSHTYLMSLFRDIGYKGRVGNTDPDGESSQTTINLEH